MKYIKYFETAPEPNDEALAIRPLVYFVESTKQLVYLKSTQN